MSLIIETPNPFEPFKIQKHVVPDGTAVIDWVCQKFPEMHEFPNPTICIFNGKPLLRRDWGQPINKGDIVNFIAVPGYVLAIIILVVLIIAVTLYMVLSMEDVATPGEIPDSDPVFSTKGQQNAIRLGEPIEVSYGKNRIYPSLAARPYFQYRDNDQYQYSLFCIGQGSYDIEEIRIGDTPIANYQEVQFEVVPPEGTLTLFPTNVFTSLEAGGQTLLGPNEEAYVPDGWVGPFPANPSGTEATEIQFDVVFPKGLYLTTSRGGLEPKTVSLQVQARPINNAGASIGDWVTLLAQKKIETFEAVEQVRDRTYRGSSLEYFASWIWQPVSRTFVPLGGGDVVGTITNEYSDANPSDDPTDRPGVIKTRTEVLTNSASIDVTGTTTTPQRRTRSVPVMPGRYEVRMRRLDDKDESFRAGHDVVWEGLRSFITTEADFGAVTLLAVIIRATNNLNARTQTRFNVIATRKLAIRESSGFSTVPVATRSIVWAFVDVFRNVYGGRIISDAYFDWDALEALDALYAARGEYFDWIFRDPITVWDAAKSITRVGRSVPLLVGSLITMKRDGLLTVPVAMFNQENIIDGSFKWNIKLWDIDEHDSIRGEYTDPTTNYQQEQVICALPGSTTDNPKDVRFAGIQDRNHAYHEGLYLLAVNHYLRENVSFETGLEGYIPTYGDLIAVVHDVPKWGQAGYVVNAELDSGDNYRIWVSEPLNFDESNDYQILLRGRQAEVLGPLSAFPTSDPKQVIVAIPDATGIDFLLTGKTEPMLFVFGVAGEITEMVKVVRIEPQGGETIRITAVNDNPIIHSFDELIAPALSAPFDPPIPPDLPVIDDLIITQVDGPLGIIQVAWAAAFGAQRYIVHTSTDGENWQERADTTRTSVQLPVMPGSLWVRVAAINEGMGPWITETLVIGLLNGLELYLPWLVEEWGVRWWDVLNTVGFIVKVYDNTGSEPILKRTVSNDIDERSFLYTHAMAVVDGNVVREMMVEVDVVFEDGPSLAPAQLELSQAIPTPPTALGHDISSEESERVVYRLFGTIPELPDLIQIKVWLSTVNGFDASVVTPIIDETLSEPGYLGIPTEVLVPIDLESDGTHVAHYWRIALFDMWGEELSSNLSAQQVIPAYS